MKLRNRFNQPFFLYMGLVLLTGLPLSLSAQSDYKLAEQDSMALVAFYWSTDGPNWTSNQPGFGIDDLSSEWQTKYDGGFNAWFDGPAKDWYGVKVEKRAVENSNDSAYRVTWLWPVIGRRTDGQNQLNGYVPREIGLFTALEQFQINGNDGFTWELLPDELYHPSLNWLDVESCWFGGEISDEFRNCTRFKKLNARYNYFDYMPNLDFLDEDALRALNGTQWLYNSRLSYGILEEIIDYFYSLSPNPKEFKIEMRDMFDVGDEREIVAPLGSSVAITCNDAGEQSAFITYQWFKDGLSKFGKTNKNYSISSVSAADYGVYKARITNEYVKTYDQNTNYGEVFTKEIHLVEHPTPPIIENAISSNNGKYIELYMSKPMSDMDLPAYQNISVTAGGNNISIISAEIMGRIDKLVRVYLDSPLKSGQNIELAAGSGNGVKDQNGGELEAFSQKVVKNRTRVAPTITRATTTFDGFAIEVSFDQFIDENSFASADFLIEGANTYEAASIALLPGEIDPKISKNILLTLNIPIVDTAESIFLQYSSGNISGLYGGTIASSDTITVENQISTDLREVIFHFEDGSELLENLYLKGSWNIALQKMNDDGINGDETANDHIWTYSAQLVPETYSWDVFERKEIITYDTLEIVDPNTGVVTLTLTPVSSNLDSILSGNIFLSFSINDQNITGDTDYGIFNRDVIFNLLTSNAAEDVYLMGIEEDWNTGRKMAEINPGLLYADTLYNLTAGDQLNYNFRIGNDWENLSPDPRQYIVKNGDNLITNTFGIFTNIDEPDLSIISVYPNPSSQGLITIEGSDKISQVEVYTLLGRLIYVAPGKGRNTEMIDLTNQKSGLYILKITTSGNKTYSQKIIIH